MHKPVEQEEKKVVVKRGRPYTEQMMRDAWATVASSFTSEPVMASLLAKFIPEIAPDGRNVLVVDSPGTQAYITERMDTLMTRMRDALSNDDFCVIFSVKEVALSPEFWNDTQVVSYLMENPEFEKFYKFFGLSLI